MVKDGTRWIRPTQKPSVGKADYPSFDNYMNKINLIFQADISKTGELVYWFPEEESIFRSITIRHNNEGVRKRRSINELCI